MSFIAKQPYIKVIREVSSIKQTDVEHERNLFLYADKIVTEHREFPLADVLDLSYRKIGEDGGILFLHTNHSVYSYTVKSSPHKFVDASKEQLRNK